MQVVYKVKTGYVYVDQNGRPQAPGIKLKLDPTDPYVHAQLWKLEQVEQTVSIVPQVKLPAQVELADGTSVGVHELITMPVEEVKHDAEPDMSAQELVDSLEFLVEPPKVIVDPEAVKPGEGVDEAEASTMMSRVEDFIAAQETAAKEKAKKKAKK